MYNFKAESSDLLDSYVADLMESIPSLLSILETLPAADNRVAELHAAFENLSRKLQQLAGSRHRPEDGARWVNESLTAVRALAVGESKELVYCSPAMQRVVDIAERAANCNVPVLVLGQTGVGKDLIARLIHSSGRRSDRPFIPINSASVPKDLLESYLFGHRNGAFTGANRDQRGVIREANGGVLLLDEIGEMPLELQPKLLRFLQEGEIHPVGECRPIKVDVQVVASTNRDLRHEVDAGRFRADLFYRLNIISVELPPLCERREDIPVLLDYFCIKQACALGVNRIHFTSEALELLLGYNWPGNVRELCNLTLKLTALYHNEARVPTVELPGEITRLREAPAPGVRPNEADTDPDCRAPAFANVTLSEAIDRLERQKVREALIRHNWNFTKAARHLGLSPFGLRKKYRRLFSSDGGAEKLEKQPGCQQGCR